jgi:hypothetical protein
MLIQLPIFPVEGRGASVGPGLHVSVLPCPELQESGTPPAGPAPEAREAAAESICCPPETEALPGATDRAEAEYRPASDGVEARSLPGIAGAPRAGAEGSTPARRSTRIAAAMSVDLAEAGALDAGPNGIAVIGRWRASYVI